MDGATYARSIDYTLAKSRFAAVSAVFRRACCSSSPWSAASCPSFVARVAAWGAPGAAWTGAAALVLVAVLFGACSLPFDAWEQFSLEARFGFNRAGPALWICDKAKGLALGLMLGFPLLWALLALVRRAGSAWWLWAFALVFGFQLAMIVIYPRVILPLSNRLSPLPEGDLRTRLFALGERTGFRAATIEVMDGSKRSGHSNAFFTGFGRFRRIVLFDTLVGQLRPEELEAVLAHEIGHYRCGHVPKHLALSGAMLAASFAVIAWLVRENWFNSAFGLPPGSLDASFLLFGLLSGLVTFWFTPLANLLSRRHEYQADAFARRAMGAGAPLVGALRRLAEKNLSNLTPHPWFSAFHYSHPTLVEREKALATGG